MGHTLVLASSMKTSDVCIFKLNISLASEWEVLRANDLLSWVWSTEPLSFQGQSAHQGQGPTLGWQLSSSESFPIFSSSCHFCVLAIYFMTWLTVVILVCPLSANLSLTSLNFCVYIFPFLPVWVLLSFMTSIHIPPSLWNHPWLSKPAFSFSKNTRSCLLVWSSLTTLL